MFSPAILSTALVIVLQLPSINARPASHTATPRPSLQLPKLNHTQIFSQIGQLPNVTALNGRVEIDYPVPDTQMTLSIISDPDSPMEESHIRSCLEAVINIASQSAIRLHTVFWHTADEIRFGVAPTIYSQELTWEDLKAISKSLIRFYQNTGRWGELSFFIGDAERGALGSGLIEGTGSQPKTFAAQGNGNTATS